MTRDNEKNNPRGLVHDLITQGLGYCCVWAFLFSFRKSGLIAVRLGVDTRTVRRWRARVATGEVKCEGCEKCMKEEVIRRRKLMR